MPFGSIFKKVFKKTAEKYGGEGAGDVVEAGFEQLNIGENEAGGGGDGGDQLVEGLMQVFSGKQQSGLSNLFGALGGSLSGFSGQAEGKGLDPALINAVMNMLTGGGGGGGEGASGGSGFNMGSLLQVASSLTSKSGGDGGSGGFMSLLNGLGGGGNSNNILQILIGLAKSFFAMQMGKNPSLQDWGKAGAKSDDDNIGNYGDHLVKDLVFPGKKDKDVLDEDTHDKPTDDNDVKGWYDKHPEIGKMQKDVFDDIFDTTDEDERDDDDPAPLIPAPKGFTEDCSNLDQAAILFLNTNILLELRKSWRFLFSTKVNEKSEFVDKISYQGPTLIVVQDSNGNTFGAFASTSWGNTEGGWTGNGDCFVFAIKPKMAVFYATGKNENYMSLSEEHGLGLGGKLGHFGLGIQTDLSSGTYNEEVETFDLPASLPSTFDIEHVEVWGLGPEVDPSSERSELKVRKPNLQISGGNVDMNDLLGQIS